MAATLSLSSKVLQAAFAYEDAENSIAASGTFTANSDAIVGISGEVTGVGTFSASKSGANLEYVITPADVADAGDLGEAAKAIVDTINGALAVPTPEISGTSPFETSTEVTITVPERSAVYYTTDGNTPTSGSTAYTEPITLDATTTVKAIAVRDGISSAVASETFTKTEAQDGEGGDS